MGRIECAEDHGYAALASQRGEVGCAAAKFRHDSCDARQDLPQGRPGHARYEHVARRDTRELALAVDDTCLAGRPADAGWLAVQARVPAPTLVGDRRRLKIEWPGLQELESCIVHGPLDFDRHAHQRFRLLHQIGELDGLSRIETRNCSLRAAREVGPRYVRATGLMMDRSGP